MATNLETIEANGLLAELAYLTLESKYYKEEYGKDYSSENIIDYLKDVTTEEIKATDPDYFTNIFGKDNDKTADDYRGISSHRKEVMLELLDQYEIIDFASDDGTFGSDFQGMLLKEKSTRKYIVSFRGTASLTDIAVDAIGTANWNLQYNEAKEFVQSIIADPDIPVFEDDLTLVGHSLGGILTPQVGATMGIEGFAYNPWVSNQLLNSIFFPFSSLQKENISSLTTVNSNNIFFSSLDYKKNLLFTNRFNDEREVA